MENKEKVLTPQESLMVIRETIDLAKARVRDNGFHFLLWGWLVVIACLGEYYLREIWQFEQYYLVWLLISAIGAPTAIVYEWRRNRGKVERNIVQEWYDSVWLSFVIALILGIFFSLQYQISPVPFILIIAGGATFLSGKLLRFRPLEWGAVAFWIGAGVCIWMPREMHGLVQAIATMVGYLVPGHMLNGKPR